MRDNAGIVSDDGRGDGKTVLPEGGMGGYVSAGIGGRKKPELLTGLLARQKASDHPQEGW